MRSVFVLLGSVALAAAQAATANATCCAVSPDSVDINQRLSWCRAQRNTCPEVCTNGQTSANTCDENTLSFTCTCASGSTPNISDYSQTLPSLECDEWKRQCIAQHPNDLAGQNFCLSYVCGTRNATAGGKAVSSASSASASGSASRTGSATSSPTSSSTSNAAVMLKAGREYGTGAILLGITGLFAFAL